MICIGTGAAALKIAAASFTLMWTHSVEKTSWQERWTIEPAGLRLVEGRVEGSGAGMEPPADAVLRNGAYVYQPRLPLLDRLVLAASGATGAGWILCPDGGACIELGRTRSAPIVITTCDRQMAIGDQGRRD